MISKAKVMSLIERNYRQWGDEYDATQILGDIEDMPEEDARPKETGMSRRIKFVLDGCDISFYAEAPADITLEQLLRQCDRIYPDWCACGIRSFDFDDKDLEISIDYDNVTRVDRNHPPCSILPQGVHIDEWRNRNEAEKSD